jgi:predicted nucleic acid-binding protein
VIVYFDTSALVKTILNEDDSDAADSVWDIATSRVANHVVYAEAHAALAAARGAGRLDAPGLREALDDLADSCDAMVLVDVDRALARSAGSLAETHRLRGYDAIHLATALSLDDPTVIVATWDRGLARAARASQLAFTPA